MGLAYDMNNCVDHNITGSTPAAIVEKPNPDDYAYSGSGSNNWPPFFVDASGSIFQYVSQPSQSNTVPIESIQKYIADTWGISMGRLADYCMTTRRSLYNWREDINPRDSAMKRLHMLYRVAKDWREAGSPNPRERIHEKLLGDKSLHDLLLEEELDINAIGFIRSRLNLSTLSGALSDPFES